MASEVLCHYALIRYVADPARGEAKNIGVLVLAPELRYAGVRLEVSRMGLQSNNRRYEVLKRLLRNYQIELSSTSQLSLWQTRGEWTPRLLNELHDDATGLIQFSIPGVGRKEPNAWLNELF